MTEPIFSQQDFDQRLFLVELLTILFCECWSVFRTGDGFNLDKSIKLFQKLHLSTDFLHFLSSAVSFCWNDDAPVLFSVVNFETSLHQSLHRHPWHCCIFSFAYLLVPECLIDSWSCHFSSKFSWALTHFHWHPCNCQAQCPNVAISKLLPWSMYIKNVAPTMVNARMEQQQSTHRSPSTQTRRTDGGPCCYAMRS